MPVAADIAVSGASQVSNISEHQDAVLLFWWLTLDSGQPGVWMSRCMQWMSMKSRTRSRTRCRSGAVGGRSRMGPLNVLVTAGPRF